MKESILQNLINRIKARGKNAKTTDAREQIRNFRNQVEFNRRTPPRAYDNGRNWNDAPIFSDVDSGSGGVNDSSSHSDHSYSSDHGSDCSSGGDSSGGDSSCGGGDQQ